MKRFVSGVIRLALIWVGAAVLAVSPTAWGEERAEVFVQMGHMGNVLAAALSPDGRYVLSGGRDAVLKLWEVASGREIRTLIGHLAAVNGVAFSPDGRQALSGSSDGNLKLWDLSTGQAVKTFTGHMSVVSTVAWSSDGRYALSGGLDTVVKLWDVSSGLELKSLTGHTDNVTALSFGPDGKTALSAGDDGALRLWDLAAGREIRTFSGHPSGVTAAALSPDGRYALSGGWDSSLRLWDVATGREIKAMTAPNAVLSVVFSPDGRYALAGGLDRVLTLWDLDSGRAVRTFLGHTDQVTSVAFGPEGRVALSGSWDGTLKLWDVQTGREVQTFEGWGDEVETVSIKPGGGAAVSGGGGQAVTLWDIDSGRCIRTFTGHTGGVNRVVFSPDGRYFLSAGRDGLGVLWDAATGQALQTFRGHLGSVESAAFSPDGRWVLTGSLDRTVKVWEAADGREIKTYEGFPDSVEVLVVSPCGRYVLTPDSPGFRLWDIATGKEVRRFAGHGPGVEALAFSPDGRFILSGSFDRTLKLWDAATGLEVRTFTGHTDSVEAVAFSPDGRYALSGSWDTTLKLWDVASGLEVRTFTGHSGWVESVAFSPDGRRAYSGSADGTARLWDIATGRELARFIGLTGGEWIVITLEGYYSSSGGGHSSLNVRLGGQVYGIDQFYDVFYRPDIVEHKLKGHNIEPLISFTLEAALKSPPPRVEIIPLPDSSDAARIQVGYRVFSTGGGIGEVRVFHNGKLVKSDGFYRPGAGELGRVEQLDQINSRTVYEQQRSLKADYKKINRLEVEPKGDLFSEQVDIDVAPGENVVSVCAFNQDNTIQSRLYSVVFTGRRPLAEPRLYILTVGIDKYVQASADLKYAAKDAKDMAEKLKAVSSGVFSPGHIHTEVLTDDEAGKANILKKVQALAEKAELSDMVIVFFAGHGLLRDEQYYFVTHEYAGRLSDECLISSNEVVEMSKRFRPLSQLFIFDSCHAGGVDYIIGGLYDARMSVMAKKLGLHIYASCSSRQGALDGYQGNGLFTHNLLAGLNNNPGVDENSDQYVSVVELGKFIREHTAEISRGLGYTQTPTVIDFGRDIPVYRLW
ncbi:MAG: caspase family protein [Thermodesulfobacteriota bacterium]